MPSPFPRLAAVLLGAAALIAPAPALGHGAPPDTRSVVTRPGADDELLVGTTVGALISRDDGKGWDWICDEALAPTGRADPLVLWTPGGALLAGDIGGLGVSRDLGCTWTEHPAFAATGVSDVQLHPTRAATVLATTTRYGQRNGLFISTDDAVTFAPSTLFRDNTYFTTVRVAPSRPTRLFVGAWWFNPPESWLYRSDDDGASWTEVYRSAAGFTALTVLAVHPTNPDVLLAAHSDAAGYQLLRSGDAGLTFQVVAAASEPFRQAAFSLDGATAWASRLSALYRSTDQGLTFTALAAPTRNTCVHQTHSGSLLVCGSPREQGWALARGDGAEGFTPLLYLQNIRGPLECPAGSSVQKACPTVWPELQAQLELLGPVDAGSEPPVPPKGCGCQGMDGSAVGAPGLLALLAWLRARRRGGVGR